MEKNLLSDSCKEYAASEVRRLEEKAKHETLNAWESISLDMLGTRTPAMEHQQRYYRREFLGVGIQLLAVPLTSVLVRAAWDADEEERSKEAQRSELFNAYRKTAIVGRRLVQGLFVVLLGNMAKDDGLSPEIVWRSRGLEFMDGLNKILVPLQAIQDLAQSPVK
jgi:hypothetical protein